MQRFDHIRYTLIGRGASRHDVFLDTSSAQYAALVWLTRDDPRMLDPESAYLEQRYGLAALYFGTTRSGYEWHVPKVIDDDADTNGEGGGGGGGEGDEEAVGPENDDDEYGDDEYDKDDGDADYGENADDDDVVGRVRRRDLATRRRGTVQTMGKDASGWFRHENWLSSYGVCSWEGVTCPQQQVDVDVDAPPLPPLLLHDPVHDDGDVSRLELRRNNLHGLLPDEVFTTLPYLEVLDLSDNGLAGVLSPKVGGMVRLETLNLTSNDIAGSIPSKIGNMTSLKILHLADNLLEYPIPHAIGGVASLRHLDLSGNSIGGTIPYTIGRLAELSTLDLSWNLLLGPLPHEFSELQTLVSLDVGNNNLGGPVIAELGRVTYLSVLRLNDNHFSGEVPSEIGTLVHLEELR